MAQDVVQAQIQRATAIQEKYAAQLMKIPGVVGVAVGFATKNGLPTDDVALIVMVQQKMPAAQIIDTNLVVPRELEGVRVDVQETGIFSAGAT